jgi:PKD repeat protein
VAISPASPRNSKVKKASRQATVVTVAPMLSIPVAPSRFTRATLACAAIAGATIVLSLSFTAGARAADGSQYGSIGQYGELNHFGGFDSTWFAEDAYNGGGSESQPTASKFVDPVGFAVDTQDQTPGGDGTAIYVLDRVSGAFEETAPAEGTRWRLQKLSDTGELLGRTEFFLPASGVNARGFSPTGVEQLAIDDTTGRVFTVLYGTSEEGPRPTTVAEEVIGWSTTVPTSGAHANQLVAPGASGSYPALAADSIATAVSSYTQPGVLSTAAQIGSAAVYNPSGIALDAGAGSEDLAIAGDAQPVEGNGTPQGPAVIQEVSQLTGALASSWSASALTGEESFPARGILTTPSGKLDLVLQNSAPVAEADSADLVQLSAGLTDPVILASAANTPGSGDVEDAPLSAIDFGFGSPVTELSNGLIASSLNENSAGAAYWQQGQNEGIRLVQPEAGGLLSSQSPPATSIFDVLGGGACAINDGGSGEPEVGVVLAPGANGAVWALLTGTSTARFEAGDPLSLYSDRQVIEFAPGAPGACAEPSGTFSVANAAGGSPQPASTTTPLAVPIGTTVDFDASSISYPSSAGLPAYIYAYEWNLTGASTGGPNNDGYTIVNDTQAGNGRPLTTASLQYTTPGTHTIKLKLFGDFGEYDETGEVIVQTSTPPTAAFTAPTEAQANQAVSFDASGSQPASGAHIANYHWSFGDGQSDDTQSPTEGHTYSSPGTYTVSLTVRDDDSRTSSAVTKQIAIAAAPGNTTTTTTTTTSQTQSGGGSQTVLGDHSQTNVSPRLVGSGGEVKITLTCPATKITCGGTVRVQTAAAVIAVAGKKKSGKPKKAVLLLGQKAFTLKGGAKTTLVIKLSGRGAKLLKTSKKLKVDVVVSSHDSFGDPLSRTLALTLRAPAAKK